MEISNLWLAILLTAFAGLSTGIGGLAVFLFKRTNTKVLSVVLGFSAGVMIYISFVELLSESKKMLISSLGSGIAPWINMLSFFGGILLIAIIDKLVPSYDNPHESHRIEEASQCGVSDKRHLMRTGILTALIIGIHNFPEGMATFISSVQNPALGVVIAIAIAIHNIPEGMSVAIPVYCAGGSKRKALAWSFLSGLAEPIGGLAAYLVLMPFLNDTVFGVLYGAIAGIMVFISFDELLPTARKYGEHHLSIYGLICGMAVMATSLILL